MRRYTYLRWLRSGAAGAIAGEEGAAAVGARATFPVVLDVAGAGAVSRDVALHGPGDIVGVSPGQIIDRFPKPDTTTADVGAFAHVEFDEPDLPWRYSPLHERTTPDPASAALRAQDTLTPWLCLVVVEQRAGVSLRYQPGDVLPVLTVDAPAVPDEELPPPAELAAWAHVQVAGDLPADPAAVTALLDAEPHRSLSRLVCPRLLAPRTSYLACLVPVFATGRQAGLGEPVTAKRDERAWDAGATTVRLPVYDSFAFATGQGGDFEALVRRLRHVHLDDPDLDGVVGRRPVDVTTPGFGVPDRPAPMTVDLFGALRVDGDDPLPGVDPGLAGDLSAAVDVDGAVAPPMYGRWHAAVAVPGPSRRPLWLTTLNRDPGLRAVAGQGARLVQQRQEDFMAACWEQVGAVLEANQLLRQAQLGRHASSALYRRHVTVLDAVAALQLLAPALSRLRSPGSADGRTQWADVADSCLPVLAIGGHWRRLLRPRGPLVRRVERWQRRDDLRRYDPSGLVEALAGGNRLGPPPAPRPALGVSLAQVVDALTAPPKWPDGGEPPTSAEVKRLVSQLRRLERRAMPRTPCTPLPVGDAATAAVAAADPAVTVPRRARAQLRLPAGLWDPPDRIDPIMVAPRITTPMYSAVAALGQDWLLPGLQHVPQDSVSALAANQVFVEAFLAGMNHEMARELLWRGYPTDQRGSVFRHFWDRRVAVAPPTVPPGDITDLHTWSSRSRIGSHQENSAATDSFVFLLRGELLRRFPRASVVLVRAELVGGVPRPAPVDATATLPAFSGWLDPDVTFLGFDVDADEVRGATPPTTDRPGWFVVIQEQPTRPSFGVSAESGQPGPDGRYASWADLGAPDLAVVGGRTVDAAPVGYVHLAATTTAAFLATAPTGGTAWDGRADTLAAVLLRRPFRFFLHGSDILGTA